MTTRSPSPLVLSYLTGVNLAVNALRDVYLLVDGPNCVFFRTAQIQGNHDWNSTLVSCSGLHRVVDTDCTTERAAAGDDRLLISRLREVDARPECGLILLCAMSMVVATGRQYDKLLRDLEGQLCKPVVFVPPGSLEGDWLLGYSRTLAALANGITLDDGTERHEDRVAVVGYLWDRNEADHRANLAELRRLLDGLGLGLCSCWLSGGTLVELAAVSQAGTIISLPYGREAARILAGRTRARLVECSLPVGLDGTGAFLRTVGDALGRSEQAGALVERELAETVPKLQWILPHSLLNQAVVVMGDPHLAQALAGMAAESGCRVVLKTALGSYTEAGPDPEELREKLEDLRAAGSLDLGITNSMGLALLGALPGIVPFVELGFPSHHTHALHDEPYLGYRGTLKLVERMANAISHAAVHSKT
jgi:nitrogenase molybdenum-iron protein alpha/beta subunit